MANIQKAKEGTNVTSVSQEAAERRELIRILGNSLYPGARPESIDMVLSYCKAAQLDPMQKVVHIVPMSVKGPNGRYMMRDVIMPGIALYRVQASRTGSYVGRSEPEFGEVVTEDFDGVKVTYPVYCRVTVRRKVAGEIAEFTAVEFWRENYATARRDSIRPNAMWRKRPFAQLAKCAEAQALRAAFPELIGGVESAEEMEGRTIDPNEVEDVTVEAAAESKTRRTERRRKAAKSQLDAFSNVAGDEIEGTATDVTDEQEIGAADDEANPAIPRMPDDAAKALSDGKWGAAWKWFEMVAREVPAQHRRTFVAEHEGLLALAQDYNEKSKAAVAALLEELEVTTDDDEADPERPVA